MSSMQLFDEDQFQQLMRTKFLTFDFSSECDTGAAQPVTEEEICIADLFLEGCLLLADPQEIATQNLREAAECVFQRANGLQQGNPLFIPDQMFNQRPDLLQNCSEVDGVQEYFEAFSQTFPPTPGDEPDAGGIAQVSFMVSLLTILSALFFNH